MHIWVRRRLESLVSRDNKVQSKLEELETRREQLSHRADMIEAITESVREQDEEDWGEHAR